MGSAESRPLTCEDCQQKLQDLVDNELPPSEAKAIKEHIQDCPDCLREFRAWADFTTSLIQQIRPLRPSGDLTTKIMARLAEQKKTDPDPSGLPRQEKTGVGTHWPAWPLAACLILAVTGLLVLFLGKGDERIAWVASNPSSVLIHRFDREWKKAPGETELRTGDRIELAGDKKVAQLRFSPEGAGSLILGLASLIQFDRQEGKLILYLTSGHIFLSLSAKAKGFSALRVIHGEAWVEFSGDAEGQAEVETLEGGELKVAIKKGSARLGNPTQESPAVVAEKFWRQVPQHGPIQPAREVDEKSFQWMGE